MTAPRLAGGDGASAGASRRKRPWKRPESVLVVVHAGAEAPAAAETPGDAVAAAAPLAPERRVLLLRRADDPRFWQSVTGSLEPAESPADAARRELLEETGLALAPRERGERATFEIRGPWRARYAPGVTVNLEHVFELALAVPCAVTLAPAEHVAFEWVAAGEAMARVASATNRAAIARIVAERAP